MLKMGSMALRFYLNPVSSSYSSSSDFPVILLSTTLSIIVLGRDTRLTFLYLFVETEVAFVRREYYGIANDFVHCAAQISICQMHRQITINIFMILSPPCQSAYLYENDRMSESSTEAMNSYRVLSNDVRDILHPFTHLCQLFNTVWPIQQLATDRLEHLTSL